MKWLPRTSRRPRLRTLLLFLLLLVAGAAVNVAVAWGCSVWPSWQECDIDSASTLRVWRSIFPDCDLSQAQVVSHDPGVLLDLSHGSIDAEGSLRSLGCQMALVYGRCSCADAVMVHDYSAGLPMRSMWAGFTEGLERPSQGWFHVPKSLNGAAGAGRMTPKTPIAIPLIPLWPGFAINTAFYAAICWLLFAAPFVVCRRRRIKRGLCPACAYPVGTSDLCTECGKPVPHSDVEPAP